MEKVRILGLDPSLRNTGMAIVEFNTELPTGHNEAYKVLHCQTISNPQKYTGKDAILNMLDMLHEESQKKCYQEVDDVLIESPSVMFNKSWSGGTISSLSHISGGCIPIFGIQKARIFRPTEWNKSRKKEVTQNQIMAVVGNPDTWHFEKRMKSEKLMEHIIDAVGISLFWIKSNYLEE